MICCFQQISIALSGPELEIKVNKDKKLILLIITIDMINYLFILKNRYSLYITSKNKIEKSSSCIWLKAMAVILVLVHTSSQIQDMTKTLLCYL